MLPRGKKNGAGGGVLMWFYFSYVIFLHSGSLEIYENDEAKGKMKNVLFEISETTRAQSWGMQIKMNYC